MTLELANLKSEATSLDIRQNELEQQAKSINAFALCHESRTGLRCDIAFLAALSICFTISLFWRS
jgi:hypothetical protein